MLNISEEFSLASHITSQNVASEEKNMIFVMI